jgi:hypothetical protein
VPIAEGPTPGTSWKGYHAGKHGVYETFNNLRSNGVNMGELFFGERYRYVRSEWKDAGGRLKFMTEAEFQTTLKAAFDKFPGGKARPVIIDDLSGVFDSEKFTADIHKLYRKYGTSPRTTIWQGRYVAKDFKTGAKTICDLQTNVDFEAYGRRWRLALDAKTGRALNFFEILEVKPGEMAKMEFTEVVVRWKGKITNNVQAYTRGTVTVRISATWKGLMLQGAKAGAITGGLTAGFLGAISGFKKEGIPGALKGFAIGAIMGAGFGGAIGGAASLASRIWPWVGKVAKIGGFILTVVAIMLDSAETALDPPEFHPSKKDKDGNLWFVRNVKKEGVLFPEYTPRGIKIVCTDKTVIEMGDEMGWQSAYPSRPTPINVIVPRKKVNWQMVRTPEGSSMWWWRDTTSGQEHILTFRDDQAMSNALKRYGTDEKGHYFKTTRG